MECKLCGAENAEDAVFCMKCGKRLDGKEICARCGREISAEAVFCSYCGAKVGEAPAAPVQPIFAGRVLTEEERTARNTEIKKIFNVAAVSFALFAAACSLIFVFFIGLQATYGKTVSDNDIFYYFGKCYEEAGKALDEMRKSVPELSSYFITQTYFPLVLGTVISAGSLVSVISLSAVALTRCVKTFLGKPTKNACGTAWIAAIMFIVSAVAFMSLSKCKLEIVDATACVSFNGATLAGIVLCSVGLVGSVVCSVAVRGKELINFAKLKTNISTVAAGVLCTVLLIVLSLPEFRLKGEDVATVGIGDLGVLYILGVLQIFCITESDVTKVENANAVSALAILTFVVFIVTLIFAGLQLYKTFKNAEKDGNKSFVLSLLTFIGAFAYLVLSILTASQFTEALHYVLGTDAAISISYAVPITVFVFALLVMVADIIRLYFSVRSAAPAVSAVEEKEVTEIAE